MSMNRVIPTWIIGILVFLSSAAQAASPNSVQGFVYEWFGLFDQNAPVENFLEHLDDNDLHMEFPERTLTSLADFADWYSGILTTYRTATHDLKNVDVKRDGSNWSVDLVVLWKADSFDGSHAEFLAHQNWTIVESADGKLLIRRYIVQPAEQSSINLHPQSERSVSPNQTPAAAKALTCTCHGGPGNYAFACAPIQKTCYGGPGYYPYQCSVCPEG